VAFHCCSACRGPRASSAAQRPPPGLAEQVRDADGPFYRGTVSLEDIQGALKKLREAGFVDD
jgi:hypothetical protein